MRARYRRGHRSARLECGICRLRLRAGRPAGDADAAGRRRRMSRPADLEGLPWPDGEPGPLRAAAGRLRGLGSGLSGASGTLGGATPSGWSGVAAGSYAATIAQAGDAVSYLEGTVQT